MSDPVDLRSEVALSAFIDGLDSKWHTPESRRSWCRLFLRDAAMGHLRLAPPSDDAAPPPSRIVITACPHSVEFTLCLLCEKHPLAAPPSDPAAPSIRVTPWGIAVGFCEGCGHPDHRGECDHVPHAGMKPCTHVAATKSPSDPAAPLCRHDDKFIAEFTAQVIQAYEQSPSDPAATLCAQPGCVGGPDGSVHQYRNGEMHGVRHPFVVAPPSDPAAPTTTPEG